MEGEKVAALDGIEIRYTGQVRQHQVIFLRLPAEPSAYAPNKCTQSRGGAARLRLRRRT
jgi:hypothetical protein